MIKPLVDVCCLGFVVFLATLIHGQSTPSPDGFDETICQSSIAETLTTLSVQSLPSTPIDVSIIPGTHSKYEITCIQIYEDGPVLATSQVGLCSTPAIIYICYAFVSTPAVWVCDPHTTYQQEPRTSVTIGGQDHEEKYIKVQWAPQSSGVLCFPRDLTVQMVGLPIVPTESNLAANIAFIIIVGIVLLLAVAFVMYQFRKVMRKFWKREKARPATHLSNTEHQNTLKTLRGEGDERVRKGATNRGLPKNRIDVYDGYVPDGDGETDGETDGTHIAVIDGGTVEVRAHAMPKPWFKRFNYDGNDENAGVVLDDIGGGDPRRGDFTSPGGGSQARDSRSPNVGGSSAVRGVESIQREADQTVMSPSPDSHYYHHHYGGGGGGQSGSGYPRGGNYQLNSNQVPPTSSMYYQAIQQQPPRPQGSYYAAHNNQPYGGSPPHHLQQQPRASSYDVDY